MEKLTMCRMCLAQNVRLCIVANRNLHKLYEKLTGIPFITQDSRPILACVFCFAKLKQCYRLVQQCLRSENFFAQRMNGNSEPNSLTNENHFPVFGGFTTSRVEQIDIVGHVAVKEELSEVSEIKEDVIEPKEEYQSDEPESENLINSGDDVSLIKCKIEVEDEEVPKKKRRTRKTIKLESENFDNSCLDVADIPPHCYESDLEDDVPLINCKIKMEDEEVSKKKRNTETVKLEPGSLDNSCLDVVDIAPHCSESDLEDVVPWGLALPNGPKVKQVTVVMKPKQERRSAGEKDTITAEQTTNDKSDAKVIRTTQKWTSKPGTYFKEPRCKRSSSNKDKGYKCDVCQRIFSVKGNLTKHMRIHSGEKRYKCDLCHRNFSERCNLTNHMRIHTGEKPYECDYCQRNFIDKSKLTVHIRIHTGEKPYECYICQRNFGYKSKLRVHMLTHTGEKPHKCNFCQRSFNRNSHLTRHMLTHTGEKPYECDYCQRNFIDKSKLTGHIRVHTGEKPYECNICKRDFGRKNTLTVHMRTHTGEKPHKCYVCHRNFLGKGNLTNHMRTHTSEKPHKCYVCHRNFLGKGNLKNHMRIHTGEKPYECDFCQRNFNQRSHLINHIRTHSGEKPYECVLCQRHFSRNSNLTAHMRTHTGQKLHKCDLCQRNFSELGNLTKHMRTHTGEKPYECDFCQRKFGLKGNLTRHKRTHTGEKPYGCVKHTMSTVF